jgi:Rps23 Pro-64 3,4-dihydroxylase Tpa1-like proline 4-hydroxylase
MAHLTRDSLSQEICRRLEDEKDSLRRQWQASAPINYFVLDDVLPEKWSHEIYAAFPNTEKMTLKRSLRELKYVSAQMNKYDSLLEEGIYAFQTPQLVKLVEQITQIKALEPDEMLYAGGISTMARGHYLNPHVDNSHDKSRERYRVLNLLYYVSPDWTEAAGCNLELWPDGPEGRSTTILSRFNRLVVMLTHQGSWHSVSRNVSNRLRCCVSNYYFSKEPPGGTEYFHVTSFRGRPEQPIRDMVLRTDIWLRTAIRRLFPSGIAKNQHYYDKRQDGR